MSIFVTDRATIAGTHRTADGYLAASARIARVGIQTYSGREVDKPEMATVRIYRAPEEVFAPAAMASIAHKPITLDHPAENVDASRWKDTAVGWIGDTIQRDGDFIRVPMMVADAAAISSIESGARQISAGYTCDLVWGAGTTPEGEAYDARQVGIRINHVAVVPAGRAGSACRIGDSSPSGAWSPNVFRLAGLGAKDGRATIADEWPEAAFRAAGMTATAAQPASRASVTNDSAGEWANALARTFPRR